MSKLFSLSIFVMFASACLSSEPSPVEDDAAAGQQGLVCDDCDVPPTGNEPVLIQGASQEIRPFEIRCSGPVRANNSFNVLGDIEPRGALAKPARVIVWQGTTKLISLPVSSGGFSITLNRVNSPRSFPGSFNVCVKNPGANSVSIDASGTIITT